jgi:Ca2+-binding EF-hand superfamily protein
MEDGSSEMSFGEFLHALTPYQHGDLKNNSAKYLETKIPRILQMADADASGNISFSEFLFFITLLQMPAKPLRKEFKSRNNVMTSEQLEETINKLFMKTSSGSSHRGTMKLDARHVSISDEELDKSTKAILKILFENKKTVSFNDVWALKEKLRHDLWHYEFFNMDPDEKSTISIEEFLCSVVGCVKGSKVSTYLKQSKKVGEAMPDDRVSFEDYLAF